MVTISVWGKKWVRFFLEFHLLRKEQFLPGTRVSNSLLERRGHFKVTDAFASHSLLSIFSLSWSASFSSTVRVNSSSQNLLLGVIFRVKVWPKRWVCGCRPHIAIIVDKGVFSGRLHPGFPNFPVIPTILFWRLSRHFGGGWQHLSYASDSRVIYFCLLLDYVWWILTQWIGNSQWQFNSLCMIRADHTSCPWWSSKFDHMSEFIWRRHCSTY